MPIAERTRPPTKTRPCRILIVDGDEHIRRLLTNVLEEEAHPITAVGNAAEAREHLTNEGGFAVALIAARLAGESGIDLLRWLRSHRPDTPTIMLTAVHDPRLVQEASAAGACACVAKPFHVHELVGTITDALSRPSGQARSQVSAPFALHRWCRKPA